MTARSSMSADRSVISMTCAMPRQMRAHIRIAYVFYESGLSINVIYTVDHAKKRAVGFKLSEGMDVPADLAERFKFARQKSKLAGTIRGSFFAIKGEYCARRDRSAAQRGFAFFKPRRPPRAQPSRTRLSSAPASRQSARR